MNRDVLLVLPALTLALCLLAQQPPGSSAAHLVATGGSGPALGLGSPSTEGPRATRAYGSAVTRWLQGSQDPLVLSWIILKIWRRKQKLRGGDFESEAL